MRAKFTTLGTSKLARGTQTASFPGAENFRLPNTVLILKSTMIAP